VATAISYFNQAIAKDPGYALAYSGLADAYSNLPYLVALPANTTRREMQLPARRWSWTRRWPVPTPSWAAMRWSTNGILLEERLSTRKLSSSTPAMPRHTRGNAWDLAWIGGREQEAFTEINRARQLDPLSPIIKVDAGWVQIRARQYDEAILECEKVANEDPTYANTHSCLAQAYWAKHMYAQVIGEWKVYGQVSGDRRESEFASAIEKGFRSGGWKGALTQGIEVKQTQRKTGYASAYQIALLFADLGDKDQAFRWLNTAYQERDTWLEGLKTDFQLDALRSDPRFSELVRKVGLPQ